MATLRHRELQMHEYIGMKDAELRNEGHKSTIYRNWLVDVLIRFSFFLRHSRTAQELDLEKEMRWALLHVVEKKKSQIDLEVKRKKKRWSKCSRIFFIYINDNISSFLFFFFYIIFLLRSVVSEGGWAWLTKWQSDVKCSTVPWPLQGEPFRAALRHGSPTVTSSLWIFGQLKRTVTLQSIA